MFIHAENLYLIYKGKEDDFFSLKFFFIKFCYNRENRNKFNYKKVFIMGEQKILKIHIQFD